MMAWAKPQITNQTPNAGATQCPLVNVGLFSPAIGTYCNMLA